MLAAIIADDLTGACDAAVHFAAAGLDTEVRLTGTQSDAAVTAFSTDSRDADELTTRTRILDLAKVLHPTLIFKKIDSVLRGHPGLEISMAMEAFGCDTAVITPAFPEMQRLVIGGMLQLPEPINVLMRLQADGLDTSHCHILDAATNGDLDRIVHTSFHGKVLWCGSGGLAMALAKRFAVTAPVATKPIPGPVTFCIGSTHPVTVEQARLLPGTVVPIDRNATSPDEILALLAGPLPAALFACGGDTATMIFRALGATSIKLRGEIVRGVPWGILRGGIMDGVPVVTKSGGFGAPDTLLRVAEFFT